MEHLELPDPELYWRLLCLGGLLLLRQGLENSFQAANG
jgi:hypothetical protein